MYLLIILLTTLFIIYNLRPTLEFFSESVKQKIKDIEDTITNKKDNDEKDNDKKDNDEKDNDENIKENYVSFSNKINGYNLDVYNTINNYTDYNKVIFPGKIKKTYISPMLSHENDVNKKILEHESMNIFNKYDIDDISNFDRGIFTYHRNNGIDDPIISDDNRFN